MKALTPRLRSLPNTQAFLLLQQTNHLESLPVSAAASCTTGSSSSSRKTSNGSRPFSVLNRPPPNYPGHVPLTGIERAALAVGSGVMSLLDPYRGDLIAALGEATASPYFISRLRRAMLASATGRRILRDRPRITSASLDLPRLRGLPANTVGATYAAWLDREGVSPDTRAAVRYVDDAECAYVMQRYRESHDFYHALTGLPIVREGEVALKAFEFANTLLPMTGLSLLALATLKPAERRRFWAIYGPWAVRNGLRSDEVINVYWEEEMETDVDELRARLGIETPPDLRDIRKRERLERKRLKEAAAARAVAG
ncbi:Ubiquinone biosynthesis protein [Parahypoxylon ruwenzoriense]